MLDTIVAISTPIGISAISIVRICGNDALFIAKKITKQHSIKPRYAYLKYLYNEDNKLIDRGIVIYFKAPYSFNGEDIVEFQCHGGIMIAKSIVDTAISFGARLAKAGEFSKIALMNGKMDLAMLENISQLIVAQSTQALEILARNLKGDLQCFINNLRNQLIEILSHTEVIIDYAEEDLPNNLECEIRQKLEDSIVNLDSIYHHSLSMQHIIDGHRLAIIGKPNVGKSSILNRLLLKDRAIVSSKAGTTRDIIQENITINNQIIKLIDTAGIHNTDEEIEKIGIEKTLESIKEATIIIAVFDGSNEFDDDEILEILSQNHDKIIIVVINKNDKLQKINMEIFRSYETIAISSLDSSVFKLRDLIATKIAQNPINDDSIILTNARQIECIKSCIVALQNAKNDIKHLEIFSFHINEALRALDSLSKPFCNDEMLDNMFSQFCLGK